MAGAPSLCLVTKINNGVNLKFLRLIWCCAGPIEFRDADTAVVDRTQGRKIPTIQHNGWSRSAPLWAYRLYVQLDNLYC